MDAWLPIETALPDATIPILVWLPKKGVAVSALPFNPLYDESGENIVGWDGEPQFGPVGRDAEYYGIPYDEQPTLWRVSPTPHGE